MENLVGHTDIFSGVYKGRRVLVTGHTGFKGSWLSLWLLRLGARVAGFSLYLPSDPCNFEALKLEEKITHYKGDIRNAEALSKAFEAFRPEIVFHLAAQPIVHKAYDEPKLTFDTNLGGTVNVLECIKNYSFVKAAVIITSDKCYDNISCEWGYREDDRLGGNDSYGASKACAEIACRAYISSYFSGNNTPKIVTARAGNVIGAGDWAQDRVVPDCIRAWSEGKEVIVRNPQATRPWQHVLEPLSGYLWLGARLVTNPHRIAGEAFNFGPDNNIVKSAEKLVNMLLRFWGKGSWKHIPDEGEKKESTLLKLCCDKALSRLNWRPVFDFEETVRLTAEGYKNYYDKKDAYDFSCMQIRYYIKKAKEKNISWAQKEKR